jgi:hypothetical protein
MNAMQCFAVGACALAWGAQAGAASVQVTPSATSVSVGEFFSLTVAVVAPFDGLDPLEEILAFGFDAFVSNGALAQFVSATVTSPFDDDSPFLPVDVAGSAFPGIANDGSGDAVTLAVLQFEALAPGLLDAGVVTETMSNPNHGLFYALAPDPLDLTGSVAISVTEVVPVPAAAWLMVSGLAALGAVRRRAR